MKRFSRYIIKKEEFSDFFKIYTELQNLDTSFENILKGFGKPPETEKKYLGDHFNVNYVKEEFWLKRRDYVKKRKSLVLELEKIYNNKVKELINIGLYDPLNPEMLTPVIEGIKFKGKVFNILYILNREYFKKKKKK